MIYLKSCFQTCYLSGKDDKVEGEVDRVKKETTEEDQKPSDDKKEKDEEKKKAEEKDVRVTIYNRNRKTRVTL